MDLRCRSIGVVMLSFMNCAIFGHSLTFPPYLAACSVCRSHCLIVIFTADCLFLQSLMRASYPCSKHPGTHMLEFSWKGISRVRFAHRQGQRCPYEFGLHACKPVRIIKTEQLSKNIYGKGLEAQRAVENDHQRRSKRAT